MNKKAIIIFLIFIFIFFVGCEKASEDNLEVDFEAQYIRTDGYIDDVSYPIVTIINSREELREYYIRNRDFYHLERREKVYSDTTIGFLDAIDKYDDDYFKDNVLVLVLLEEGSGSIRHEVKKVERKDSLLEIAIKRIIPGEGTDDMAQWHIMVELKKDTYEDWEVKVITQ